MSLITPLQFLDITSPANVDMAKQKETNQIVKITYISSSSSCRAASADIPDPLSPFLPIIHRLRQVFRVTSCVLT